MRQKLFQIGRVFWRNCSGLLSWLYLFTASYVTIGIYIYPPWWKRFLFAFGTLKSDSWAQTFSYPYNLVKTGDPLGVSMVCVALLSISALVYFAGKRGLRNLVKGISGPGRRAVVLVTFFFAVAVCSLAFVQSEYKTTDEMIEEIEGLRGKLLKPWRLFETGPPVSGFYVYLNEPKVAECYNSLQEEFVVSSSSISDTGKRSVSVTMKGGALSGEGSKEHEHQHSVIRKAVEASPARQADWLIRTYSDRDILVEISEFSGPESYEVREARKTLVQRGVTLTDEQEKQLVASDKAVFANKVMRSGSNAPIIVGGPLKLQYLKEQLMVEFSTKGDRSIVCVGALNEALVPKDLVSCAHSHSECKFPGKMLAIVWKVDSSTQNVVLSVIPMAIW